MLPGKRVDNACALLGNGRGARSDHLPPYRAAKETRPLTIATTKQTQPEPYGWGYLEVEGGTIEHLPPVRGHLSDEIRPGVQPPPQIWAPQVRCDVKHPADAQLGARGETSESREGT